MPAFSSRLRSTAQVDGETVSRIVGLLSEGSVVSTPRHHTGVCAYNGIRGQCSLPLIDRHRAGPRIRLTLPIPNFCQHLHKVADGLGKP